MIENTNTQDQFVGTGLTTIFASNVMAYTSEQFTVYSGTAESTGTLLTETSDYVVSNLGVADGAVFTFSTAPAAGAIIRVFRNTPATQETDISTSRAFNPEVLEQQLDLLAMGLQEAKKAGDLALKVRVNSPAITPAEGASFIWQNGAFAVGPTAGEIALAQSYAERAELAAGALTSLTDRIAYPFEITLADGRGPYALPYAPGSATYLDVVINRLVYVAPDDFTVVAMPSAPSGQGILFTADHYAGDAVLVKYGLPVGHDPALNTALTYATLADFSAAVTAGLVLPNGQTVTAGGVQFVAEVGAALPGLPIGWRPVGYVYTYAEVELWATAFQPGAQYIVVNEDGYYVAYERDPTGASTDLTTTYGEAFIKRGISPADLTTLAVDVANAIRQNATSGIGVYGGTADAITLTVGSGYAVFPAHYTIKFRATATNTGAATVAVDGLPAVALRTVTGVALPAGYIRTDVDTEITFDGTYWVADRAAERGGTDDSGFERYANGTLRVWKKLTGLGPISTANGSLFNSAVVTVGTLAADFLTGTVPSVVVFGRGGTASCWAQGIADPVGGVGSTGGTFQLVRSTSTAAATFKADCKYEGVWF